jgi:hypothetical protein
MLRGPTCVTGTWSERCVDRLPHCPRTIPTDPYRIDTAVPWVRLLSSLFDASSLFTGIRMRESAHFKTPTRGILDRRGPGAWSNRCALGCPTVLLIMKSLMNRFVLICSHCKTLLRPKPGDCCVFCSYGSIKCPPMQDENCDCCAAE